MSKEMIMNSDSIAGTSPSGKKRLLSLNREVVGCRVCPRLVNHREVVAKVKKKQFLNGTNWAGLFPGFGVIMLRFRVVGLAQPLNAGNRRGRGSRGDWRGD